MANGLSGSSPRSGRPDASAPPHIQPTTDEPFPPPRPVEAYVIRYRPEESWAVVRPWMLFDLPALDGNAWDGSA